MNDLLAQAIAAHGGLDRWNKFQAITTTLLGGGGMWAMKTIERDSNSREMTVMLHEERASISPFGRPDWRTAFTPERIAIETTAGAVIQERTNPKASFAGHVTAQRLDGWTAFFLVTTAATSATGFFFPFHGVTPAIATGIISLVVLAVAIFARYARHLAGAWRKTYVISAMLALYLNVFVLVVQAFLKIPALKEIAPTQNDPPFKITQLVVLVAFVALGIVGAIKFRSEPTLATQPS